jgi:phosphoglycerol transferase MdoB-like AlkP superfamily enzyme
MNKKTLALTLLVGLLVVPTLAFAQPSGEISSIDDLYDMISTTAWTVLGIVVLVAFIYAAILFLTAGGQPEKISAARNAFLWGVVGVVVGILAWSILKVVESLF